MRRNELLNRLLVLLASANWSKEDVAELFRSIRYESPSIVGKDYDLIYFEVRDLLRSRVSGRNSYEGFVKVSVAPSAIQEETATRVAKVLQEDIKLSTSEAVEAMSRVLKTIKSTSDRLPPPNSRKSLEIWLLRVLKVYTASEVLYAASVLAKDMEKGLTPKLDWHVRGPR